MAGSKRLRVSRAQLIEEAWRRGQLRWKLRPEQLQIYDCLAGASGMKFVLYCSRRFGKSFTCSLMAIEDALQARKREIGFVAPTQKQIKRVTFPIFDLILQDCPDDLKPKWDRELSSWIFPNGSNIYLSGTDNKNYENLRGMTLYRGYVDEPGSCDDLEIIVNAILQPQTMTTKRTYGSAIILLGTPAPTAGHPYFMFKEQAKALGNFAMKTIDDNSGISQEVKDEYVDEAGGRESSLCRREYFCEDVTDTELAVIPEFSDAKEKRLVGEFPRPIHFDLYAALDPAYNDFTAYVLGYYDFMDGVYRVEAEALFNKSNTNEIAAEIKKIEAVYFPAKPPKLRVSDTALQVIADLRELHNLSFIPTRKDNKIAQVNFLRLMIAQERLFIHPRCKCLIRQMKTAIWNKGRTSYERSQVDGHFDLVDALVYLIRAIPRSDNPYKNMQYKRDDLFVEQNDKMCYNSFVEEIYG